MKKVFPLLMLFLIPISLLADPCPCELKITQEFLDSNIEPRVVVFDCGEYAENMESGIILTSDSQLKFEWCESVVECGSLDLNNYNSIPFLSIANDDGTSGTISTDLFTETFGSCAGGEGATLYFHDHYTSIYTPPSDLENSPREVSILLGNENFNYGSIAFAPLEIKASFINEQDDSRTLVKSIQSNGSEEERSLEVVADGSQSMVLEVGSGSLEIRNPGNEAEVGQLTMEEEGIYLYTSPRQVADNPTPVWIDYYPPGQSVFTSIKLNLTPPPVLLLHGLNSSGSMWSSFKEFLQENGWEASYLSSPSYNNDHSFLTLAGFADTEVNALLTELQQEDIFVNKVNIVGHSMGGLVARTYLKSSSFNASPPVVDKLITLNTPHSGSEMANLVYDDVLGIGRGIGTFIFGKNFNIDGGAMEALRVSSLQLAELNGAAPVSVNIHAISSDLLACDLISGVNDLLDLTKNLHVFIRFAYYASNTLNTLCKVHEFVLGPENDGVVRLNSQQGGLSGSTNFDYDHFFNAAHTNSISYSPVRSHFKMLLKADGSSSNFSNSGFSPVMLSPPLFTPNPAAAARVAPVEIALSGVEDRDTIAVGETLNIEITGNENTTGILIGYFFKDGTIEFDSTFTSSRTFAFTPPSGYEGDILIAVLGTDGQGNTDYEERTIYKELDDSLCPTDRIVYGEIDSENIIYQAGGKITSNAEIINNSTVEYKAGESITLNPGFKVHPQSRFIATIEDCIAPATLSIESGNRLPSAKFQVFPNPAKEEVFISLNLKEATYLQVNLTNIQGQNLTTIIREELFEEGVHTRSVDLMNYPSGLYLITFLTNDGVFSEKVMIQK